jgi:RNA polymerase sigma-70 factor (ECF subfamily)
MKHPEDSDQTKEQATSGFVHLMSVSQMNIYAYIMSVVGNSNDADDIMQNTSALMWERYSEFKSGTDFVRWGISIAHYKIKEFRKQQNRHQFNGEVLEKIHDQAQDKLSDLSSYIEKLHRCLGKLPPSDLILVKLRYQSSNSIKKISNRINISVQAVYMKLSKIHGMLSRCIKQLIIQESI